MLLSQSLIASLLVTTTALQRPSHRTRSTRLRATTASSKDADVVVVTRAAGRMLVETLLGRIREERVHDVLLPAKLVVRRSCGEPA